MTKTFFLLTIQHVILSGGFTFKAKYLDVRKNSKVECRELPVEEGEAVASQAEVEVVNQLLPTFVPSIWKQNMER